MYDDKGSDLLDYEDSDFNSIIAPDILFSGQIHFSKPFLIRGKVKGAIFSESDLVVDVGAVVNADIRAERILVKGAIRGNIEGRSLIFITSTGSVKGDIVSAQVVLEQGGRFTGHCTMENVNEA